ncbi:NhaA family Na+:H+ antiporter [Yoonia maritima]|uniref:Na(+)/H(+) antiporter NhaA n=1 Tax=Yoonia maritima TaxID=1435347 RepID=A0A2T0W512_9RHOB|nr:Na+/H+ antiporter NhaA [Yoonia maritima]PRY80566.1 NhaA family Na+:H+ antiporter [Yoonia maritima]
MRRPQSPIDPSRDFMAGSENGQSKLVWYVDYTFNYTSVVRDIKRTAAQDLYEDQAVIAFRQAPCATQSDQRDLTARAAIAAGLQGNYLDMHSALLEHSGKIEKQDVARMVQDIGLDVEQFEVDLWSDETWERIAQDRAHAVEAGLKDHSGLIIDGRIYQGAWDEASLIEALEKPLGHRIMRANTDFQNWAASAGMALILATFSALIMVNVGFEVVYERLRDLTISIGIGDATFALSAQAWVNDGLMAIFFLLVGIEIKREIVDGELSDLSKASLPLLGAIGGMAAPALIYLTFNWGQSGAHGWGVPMATDIAFTLGIMALLGDRIPSALKVLITALVIVDDLGAILVIAVFYSEGIDAVPLMIAGGTFATMLVMNKVKIYARAPYLILGLVLWFFVHESGLHATFAGVLTAAAIPSRRTGNIAGAAAQTSALFDRELTKAKSPQATVSSRSLHLLQQALDRLREPGYHLQHALEGWSNFLILPLFAFFNTGVVLYGEPFNWHAPEVLGVVAGLTIGKPLGIVLICWLAVKLGIARLPKGVTWRHMIGGGCLAGIGFTMSFFIAAAAFDGAALNSVKLAVLIASVIAAIIGTLILRLSKPD